MILGSLCGLRNTSQISQWSKDERIGEFLARHFDINKVPCYYWLLCLLKIIDPKSLNECLMRWTQSFLPNGVKPFTLSFDGKTIRSTGKMDKYDKPLHIVSAHIAELGLTFASHKTDDKSNEIPAMRELLEIMEIEGCIVVADAIHCQKETAAAIVAKKADYILNVKENQSTLKTDIEDFVRNEDLQKSMEQASTLDKNGGRVERRTSFVLHDIGWLYGLKDWPGLSTIAAINRQVEYKGKISDEWHYYISSRRLSAKDLLQHVRLEWSVESMHWLLDVHFDEDRCRIEDESIQLILNTVRKIAINNTKLYKQKTESKLPLSKIMFGCLLDCEKLVDVLGLGEN